MRLSHSHWQENIRIACDWCTRTIRQIPQYDSQVIFNDAEIVHRQVSKKTLPLSQRARLRHFDKTYEFPPLIWIDVSHTPSKESCLLEGLKCRRSRWCIHTHCNIISFSLATMCYSRQDEWLEFISPVMGDVYY